MEKIVIKIIRVLVREISPELDGAIHESVKVLEERANATSNKFDDFLVSVLKAILDID